MTEFLSVRKNTETDTNLDDATRKTSKFKLTTSKLNHQKRLPFLDSLFDIYLSIVFPI
jgi:hypothetical protein